ncbi:MAG TPA: hypothetical protein VFX30_04085 [bacterium]|nr:hypothetical protein [bacterium]
MSLRKIFAVLMVSLICAAAPSRLLAKAPPSPADKCEDAIAKKMKEAEKLKKIAFVNGSRSSIPHGPLTHYAGKGSYVAPGGERTEFEWFCDVNAASGKPGNLYYTGSKADAPAAAAAAPPATSKAAPVADETSVSKCQDAITSEIKKKNAQMSNLVFHSAKEFKAGKEGKLLEGDGSFQGKNDAEMKFDYRCLYDKLDGKITAKSVFMK